MRLQRQHSSRECPCRMRRSSFPIHSTEASSPGKVPHPGFAGV